MVSSSAISGGPFDIHPGISARVSLVESHLDTPCVSPLGTPCVSPLRQANLYGHQTIGFPSHSSLLTGENPQADATFSVSLSTERPHRQTNLYSRHSSTHSKTIGLAHYQSC